MKAPLRSWLLGLCLGATTAAAAPGGQAAPTLAIAAQGTTDGHVTLSWDSPAAAAAYELQSGRAPSFAAPLQRYAGPQQRSFLSGLEPGTHYFRVRRRVAGEDATAWGPWSAPVSVTIRPHSLTLAWSLFGAGAVLVAAIVAYLASAARQHRRGEEGLA